MGMLDAVQAVFNNYANFEGRARRSEFWYWTLFNVLVSFVLSLIGNWLHLGFIPTLWSLAVLVPSIAVGVRRLHDIGKSGWLYLISLIPLIGTIIVIVWFAQDGMSGPNMYGPDPKGDNFGGMYY